MKVKYTTIAVENMEESIKFYTEVMGLGVDKKFNPRPGLNITFMKGEGESIIELIENNIESEETPESPGLIAVGFEVEDMDTTVKELKSKGANFTMEPIKTPVEKLAFIEDPNGVRIALIQH